MGAFFELVSELWRRKDLEVLRLEEQGKGKGEEKGLQHFLFGGNDYRISNLQDFTKCKLRKKNKFKRKKKDIKSLGINYFLYPKVKYINLAKMVFFFIFRRKCFHQLLDLYGAPPNCDFLCCFLKILNLF